MVRLGWRRFLVVLSVVGVWINQASVAWGWTKAGHMVIGAITHTVLKAEDPAAHAKVVQILRAHPQYARLWQKDVEKLPPDDQELYLFMLAGRWADDIRGNPEYDKPTWHYTNGYYRLPNTPDSLLNPAATGDALTAFQDNQRKLRTAPEPLEQAVPLCWVSHLVGDIHQPMHTVSAVSTIFPDGDRGGNRMFIRANPQGEGINMHYFWDNLIIGTDDFRACKNRATELRLRPEFAREKLTELSRTEFRAWIEEESNPMAIEHVYLKGALKFGKGPLDAEPLPEGYTKRSQAIAERRGVLAGYRLAFVLKAALQPSQPAVEVLPPPTDTARP